MKKFYSFLALCLLLFSCKDEKPVEEDSPAVVWERPDESAELLELKEHENERMRFQLINSKFLDKNSIWAPFEEDLKDFSEEDYERLKPLILEKSIPELQNLISDSELTYTELTKFFIYRIRKFESDNNLALNAVISLNPDVIEQAKALDARGINQVQENSIYGMPILIKDNIDLRTMPTTAGAVALSENLPAKDAFIVDQLQKHKALILGKANLSEWAYFFCEGCPLGYSAVGGQTLNPYGRKIFESGGSSSGSGAAVAANYAVAAVGTETSGSILSPSSKNSLVGLKPTVGLLSRSGIVPISSTLDTPGPMAKTVIDAAILLDAMTGKDSDDPASVEDDTEYAKLLEEASFEGKRIGIMLPLMQDSLYMAAVTAMEKQGAELVKFEPQDIALEGFLSLLTADMKRDLPEYFSTMAADSLLFENVADIVSYNRQDSILRSPYGQELFQRIVMDSTSDEKLKDISLSLEKKGREFFEVPMKAHDLDAVLSIDNYHAGYAAVAKYPALSLPMGYRKSGEPANVTFIARPFEEEKLLQLGKAFEELNSHRMIPENYH